MSVDTAIQATARPPRLWYATFSGLCASLVGIGVARFAYTPLIPALIAAGWFTPAATAYLGAANLLGYLAGALLGHGMTRWVRPIPLLKAMMLLTAASLFACAFRDLGFVWFLVWRLISGYTGGVVMVVTPRAVLSVAPPSRRGLVAGTVFTGVGLGIAAAGTLVPFLLRLGGVTGAWLGLGALALLLTFAAWGGWPRAMAEPPAGPRAANGQLFRRPVLILLATYGLNAVGVVPPMIFLVLFIVHRLGLGLDAASFYFVLYGLGAAAGPVLAGRLADFLGFRLALRLACLVEAVAVAMLALVPDPLAVGASSLVVGALTPAVVPLAAGQSQLLGGTAEAGGRIWGYATTAYALAMALAAYFFSFLLDRGFDYGLPFEIGAAVLLAAFVLDLFLPDRRRPPSAANLPAA